MTDRGESGSSKCTNAGFEKVDHLVLERRKRVSVAERCEMLDQSFVLRHVQELSPETRRRQFTYQRQEPTTNEDPMQEKLTSWMRSLKLRS